MNTCSMKLGEYNPVDIQVQEFLKISRGLLLRKGGCLKCYFINDIFLYGCIQGEVVYI